MALLYASRELEKVQTANFDQKIGVQIIQNALRVSFLNLPVEVHNDLWSSQLLFNEVIHHDAC